MTTQHQAAVLVPLQHLGTNKTGECGKQVIVPVNTQMSMIRMSASVLQTWAVASLGVQTDAIPGRQHERCNGSPRGHFGDLLGNPCSPNTRAQKSSVFSLS